MAGEVALVVSVAVDNDFLYATDRHGNLWQKMKSIEVKDWHLVGGPVLGATSLAATALKNPLEETVTRLIKEKHEFASQFHRLEATVTASTSRVDDLQALAKKLADENRDLKIMNQQLKQKNEQLEQKQTPKK
jgi:predicted RNase H-like nuclease (RuvC/YqgF family)